MATFQMFSVLEPDQANTSGLLPSLERSLVPHLVGEDGAVDTFQARGMYSSVLKDDRLDVKSGGGDLHAIITITDQRLIYVCKHYDKVHWSKEDSLDSAFLGAGFATTNYLMTKAYHRVTSIGKAMAGQLYYSWIASVGYRAYRDRHHQAAVILAVHDGSMARYLQLDFDRSTDTLALATSLERRIGQWYLAGGWWRSEEERDRAHTLSQAASPMEAMPDGFTGCHIRMARPARTATLPANLPATELAFKLSEERAKARLKAFMDCRPPLEWFSEAIGNRKSEFGLEYNEKGNLRPPPDTRIYCWGTARGNFRGDPTSHLPSDEGTLRVLFQGWCQVLLSANGLYLSLIGGSSAVGPVASGSRNRALVRIPLEQIGSVGLVPVTGVPDHVGPDVAILSRSPNWGSSWLSSVNGEYERGGEGNVWRHRRLEDADLAIFARRLAATIAEVRGKDAPEETPVPGGFMCELVE